MNRLKFPFQIAVSPALAHILGFGWNVTDKLFTQFSVVYTFRSRANSNILTRRLCRNRSCDDNELYRSNSFKFERFRRDDMNDVVVNTLPKQVSTLHQLRKRNDRCRKEHRVNTMNATKINWCLIQIPRCQIGWARAHGASTSTPIAPEIQCDRFSLTQMTFDYISGIFPECT